MGRLKQKSGLHAQECRHVLAATGNKNAGLSEGFHRERLHGCHGSTISGVMFGLAGWLLSEVTVPRCGLWSCLLTLCTPSLSLNIALADCSFLPSTESSRPEIFQRFIPAQLTLLNHARSFPPNQPPQCASRQPSSAPSPPSLSPPLSLRAAASPTTRMSPTV